MENATDIFNQIAAYLAAFVAFVSGLLIKFQEADKRMKVVYLVGGFIAVALFLSLVNAVFH